MCRLEWCHHIQPSKVNNMCSCFHGVYLSCYLLPSSKITCFSLHVCITYFCSPEVYGLPQSSCHCSPTIHNSSSLPHNSLLTTRNVLPRLTIVCPRLTIVCPRPTVVHPRLTIIHLHLTMIAGSSHLRIVLAHFTIAFPSLRTVRLSRDSSE